MANELLYRQTWINRHHNQQLGLNMKLLKYLLAIGALTAALAISANADLMYLDSVDFASNKPNNPEANKIALATFLGVNVSTLSLSGNNENLSGNTLINVSPGDYVVAHYGDQHGGSLEIFLVILGETQVTVPGDPNPADQFANNPNSLSSARVFTPGRVPDGGSTLMLLGVALGSVEMVRRLVLKKRSPKI